MTVVASIGSAVAWMLLLPGDLACRALSVGNADSSDLIRMLINSLIWIMVGIFALPFMI